MKYLIILLLSVLLSCSTDESQDYIYIISFNNGDDCEDYSLEIDLISKSQYEVNERLKKLKNFKDVRLYEYTVTDNDYFLYFTEEMVDCSLILQRCDKENAVREIYIK